MDKLAPGGVRAGGEGGPARSAAMQPHGIMFHHFHGQQPPYGQGSITAAQFADLLHHLGRERILPAAEWLARARADELQPDDLCLTFDDNLRCQFEVALPVLRDLGLTAFWFVPTAVLTGRLERLEIYRAFRVRNFAGVDAYYDAFMKQVRRSPFAAEVQAALQTFDPQNYLSEYPFYSDSDRQYRYVRDRVLGPQRYTDVLERFLAAQRVDVAELARDLWMDDACLCTLHAEGHVVGLHSHTHPTCLAALTQAEQAREYQDNQAYLTNLLGQPPLTMSHPCNSYTTVTLEILRGLGVQMGFRANLAPGDYSLLEIPREDHANIMREMHACASLSSPATSLAMPR